MTTTVATVGVDAHPRDGRRPIFATDGVAVFRGDALAVLRELATASADACLTDPPYGERVARWDGPRCREWYVAWLREVSRVVVRAGPILTFAPRRRFDVIMSALREVRGDPSDCPLQMIVWTHGQGFRPAPGFLRPEHEVIAVSGLLRVDEEDARLERLALAQAWSERSDTPCRLAPTVGTIVEAGRTTRREATGHPTQKPEALVRLLVALTTPPGGGLIDPFCGSGTTLIAARALGREAIGIDRSIRACRLTVRRLDAKPEPGAGEQ